MRPLSFLPFLFPSCLLFLAGPAVAEGGPIELHVTSYDDGGRFFFLVDGVPGRSPELAFPPGQVVHLHLTNNGTVPHNFRVTGLPAGVADGVACCIQPGQTGEASFTVRPAGATLTYVCDLHPDLGMKGIVLVGSAGRESPGVPAILAAAALVGAVMTSRSIAKRRPPSGG